MNTKYAIGMDVSKNDFKACLVVFNDQQETKVKASRTFANTANGFDSFKEWYNKHLKETLPVVFVMEATGSYHEQLAWFLDQKEKQTVNIVLPNRAKSYMKSLGLKSKNDQVDAKGLAMMGVVQKLTPWKPISSQCYQLRALTRHLEDLQKIRTSLINQQEPCKYGMYEQKTVFRSLKATLKAIDKQIARCKEEIVACIEKEEVLREKVAYITSIKGVSTLTAAVIIAETNGFALIKNLKQLISYAGYDVKENQSGNRKGKTTITKKGNAHIRRAMHLPAFNVVRYKVKPFKNLYDRVYERRGVKMKAYVAVQAKLLRMIYTLWKKETDFDPNQEGTSIQEQVPLCSVAPIGVEKKAADSCEIYEPAALDGLPCN